MVELAYVHYSHLSKFVQKTGGVSGGGISVLIITEWTKAEMSIYVPVNQPRSTSTHPMQSAVHSHHQETSWVSVPTRHRPSPAKSSS